MTEFTPPPPPQPAYPVEYGHGFLAQPQRSNGPAVASLVLGLVACVPVLTGFLAVVFGVIGIRKTRDPMVAGKGMAVAGLILGILSMLGWVGVGSLLGYGYVESVPAGVVAKQFLQDVSAGNISAAAANTALITPAQLQTNNGQMAPFGALQSVSLPTFNISVHTGQTTMHLEGTAAFANGPKNCTFDLVKIGGTYKVMAYHVW